MSPQEQGPASVSHPLLSSGGVRVLHTSVCIRAAGSAISPCPPGVDRRLEAQGRARHNRTRAPCVARTNRAVRSPEALTTAATKATDEVRELTERAIEAYAEVAGMESVIDSALSEESGGQ